MSSDQTQPSIAGIIRLDFRDADTMEIKRTVEQKNAIAIGGVYSLIMPNRTSQQSTLFANGSGKFSGQRIAVGNRVSSDGMRTMGTALFNYTVDPAFKFEDTEPQDWTFFSGSPDYVEKVGRFNQPASNRTINTIQILDDFDGKQAFATASLNTPCIQTTSEVLDITYRIQFFYQTPDPALLPVALDYGEGISQSMVESPGGAGGNRFPSHTTFMGTAIPVDGDILNGMIVDPTNQGTTALCIKSHLKNEYSLNKTISNNIGTVIRSLGYGGVGNAAYLNVPGNLVPMSTAWAPIAPSTFPNKPIQTIHNHSANAIEWGLDVDFLSTSQGSITLDGSSWTNPDWPEFYRIDHTVTGQVGVSRYMWRVRRTTGFNGNTYQPNFCVSNRSDFVLWSHYMDTTHTLKTNAKGHGLRTVYAFEEYDQETFVTWDSTGITVNNVNKTDIVNFESTTTPALPVTGVNQVAVDSSGNIWVACKSTGLYKITDPFGSPTVTKMTTATNTLPASSEDNCYGVAIGFNGDLLAVVEGALVRSTNPTGATPLFASESFTYTGISDSNWGNVLYMRTDRDSPDYQSNIVAVISGTTQQQVWWSTAATPGITGLVSASFTEGGIGAINQSLFGRLMCSRRGGLWKWHGTAQSNGQSYLVEFGTTNSTLIGDFAGPGHGQGGFMYDYYDTPYFMACADYSSFDKRLGIWSADNKLYGAYEGQNSVTTGLYNTASAMAWETGGGRGIHINRDVSGSNQGENAAYPLRCSDMAPRATEYLDPLNGQYSPMEEIFWRRYHWNGASWELNYYADATDTASHSGGPYPGSRENFDTEDHTFTGRSMIDVTGAFASNNFASSANATFAFKLIPEAKLSQASDIIPGTQQEKPRVLLDISDATQQFQIVWDDDIQGDITIVEDGSPTVIAATSANSSTYRLVVTVAGTSVNVYLDGSQIGSTVTLSNAFDWDNTGSDLTAFLGCEVYKWDYPQRNSPMQNNFYRGVMENVQLWNVAWNGTDVTNDFGDIDGVIVSQPAANMVARYELTQSLATLETKLTHAGAEALNEGITIAFANGASPDAFVATDYHTFAVVDGIFKDNAIAFTQNYSIYFTEVDHDFTVFENGTTGTDIEASTTAITDEKAIFMNTSPADIDRSVYSQTNGQNYQTDKVPGQIGNNSPTTAGHNNSWGGMTAQPITGDGYFQGEPMFGDDNVIIGLTSTPGASHTATLIDFGIRLNPAGDVDIIEANSVVASAVATYIPSDGFRVRRIGTAITYYKVVSGVPSLIHTSGNTSTGTIYGRVSLFQEGHGVKNAIITYTRPAYVLTVGSPGGFTGFFDPDFFRVETLTTESISINIGGSPATVVVSDTYPAAMTVPGPGDVVINGELGWLIFNAADVGAAITGNVTVLYDKY